MEELKKEKKRIPNAACALFAVLLSALASVLAGYCATYLDVFSSLTENARILSVVILAVCSVGFVLLEGTAAGLLAQLLSEKPDSFLPHLTALVGYGAAFGIGYLFLGRPVPLECLISLSFYLSGFFLFRAMNAGKSKTTCVLYATVPAILLFIVVFVLHSMTLFGFEGRSVGRMFKELRSAGALLGENFANGYIGIFNADGRLLARAVESGLLPKSSTDEMLREYLTKEFGELTQTLLLLLPGAVIAFSEVLGYTATSLRALLCGKRKKDPDWCLTISGIGTLIFLFSTVFSTLLTMIFGSGVLGVILVNASLIFFPPMIAIGIRTLTSVKKETVNRHPIATVLTVVVLLISPLFVLGIIGMCGNQIRKMKKKLAQIGEDGENGENGKD